MTFAKCRKKEWCGLGPGHEGCCQEASGAYGEVTCVWTNGMAKQMFDNYKIHLAKLLEDADRARPLSPALESDLRNLKETIHEQMRGLVQNFAMPAVLIRR